MVTVYIASDHAGAELKDVLMEHLFVTHNPCSLAPLPSTSCDYPVAAKALCQRVLADAGSFGILICGTGIGMSMAANRVPRIRAALCTSEFQARAARQHNNANVLCLGQRVTGPAIAMVIADLFLTTEFEGQRHQRRIVLFDKGLTDKTCP